MKRYWRHLTALLAVAGGLLAPACASIGRPEGGARDVEPPVYVSARPEPGSRNVSSTKLSVLFNENIQLDDAFNKVIVSPAQTTPPAVSANGRRLSVELKDTLVPDMTYTIDFGDAIKDLNEGNVLDGFAIDFSTGPVIDSLKISGFVLAAENLEPAQGMLVGVYKADSLADSTVRTLPLERVARTNQYGQFTVRGLAEGRYRIYAINDINRDYHWDRSEDVAYLDVDLVPTVESIEVTDTLRSTAGTDSLVTHGGVRFLPNDVLLTWFNEGYTAQYLKDYARPTRRTITLGFGARCDSLPQLSVVNDTASTRRLTPRPDWLVPQINAGRDSMLYWISDSTVYNTDSLRLAVRYQKPDSLERLVWTTDTLRFFFKDPKPKAEKKKKKKKEEEEAAVADSLAADSVAPPAVIDFLGLKALTGTTQEVHLPVRIEFDQPVARWGTAGVHLSMYVDTVLTPVEPPLPRMDSTALLRRYFEYEWTPGAKYRLEIDSAAVTGLYGQWNKPFKHEFTVKQLEEYSAVDFAITGLQPGENAVVQLLNTSDAPVYKATVGADGHAVLRHLAPGTYFARLFVDRNANGRWDTGVLDSIQPEDVYYFPKQLKLKKNWDVAQDWNLNELPVDQQKPLAIKKNKPKLRPGEKQQSDDEDDEDEWGNSNFMGPNFGGFGGNRNSLQGGAGGNQMLRR